MKTRLLAAFLLFAVFSTDLILAQGWTQFEMRSKNDRGQFLWTKPQNWNRGVPTAKVSVEIGDDNSKKALHCVIPAGFQAACLNFELAEHGRTQGTTLRLEERASLVVHGSAVLSKDRESWFHVDGTFTCKNKRQGIRVGGPWGRPDNGEPARCHLIIGPEGSVEGWVIGINTTLSAASIPSSPWGEKYYARSTGSEVVVNGGKLIARQGLRLSTTEAKRPGALRLKGKASFLSERKSQFGIQIWCGIWEIEGGEVSINVGDIEFHGNKFKEAVNPKSNIPVGSGVAVLKLVGNGVSTIHARRLHFVDAAVLDVSQLTVPAGTYKVIDGESIKGDKLKLAPGTDASKWSLRFDRDDGDLLLTYSP